ncbi:MAG: LysM peptidoglycan-binding domain-containing protein [Rikenellaceae bacterium]|nr:LysM peptidoglycan-binding domain-containing protein [Rikenellaceae bacterium]
MKIRSFIVTLASILLGAVFAVSAQEIVVIGGAKYTIHDVAKGETLYSLAKQYGVTVDDIKAANASLVDGLKAGTRIKIPAKVASHTTAPAQPMSRMHKVVKGETLYSLAKQNNLTIEELRAVNPHIKRGLKAGQVIEIPLRATQPIVEQTATSTQPSTSTPAPQTDIAPTSQVAPTQTEVATEHKPLSTAQFRTLKQGDTAEVALLLPLGSEERPTQNYLDFYRGFLVGLDSVRMSGHSINLNLYNTAHDYNRVEQIISSGALDKVDLVVGPVYEDELLPVATALQRRNIPIVSPLANLTHTTSDLVFQMSPSPATKLEKVRSMFDGSKRVVIISTESIDAAFDAEVRSMLRDSSYVVEHKYIYEHPSVIEKREKEREKARAEGLVVDDTPSPSDMSPLLRGTEPTVIVITASNEIDVDRILAAIASANIALTARSQRVVPFIVFGNNRWNRYNNIDRAILFANNVTMLSTYHARRSEPIIRAFDKRFVEEFGTLPSLYAYRGYDAAVVFIKSLFGAMETGLEGAHLTPLLTPYSFEQHPTSGIRVNNQWIKVNYNSNFTITTE